MTLLQNQWYVAASMLLTLFQPIYGLIIAISIFIVIDFITGICASYKRKENIESRKMMKTFWKFFASITIVTLLYYLPMICFGTDLYLAHTGAFILMSAQLFSIGENCGVLTGSNIFTKIIKGSIGKMVEYLNKK